MVFPIAIVGGGTAGLAAASMVSRMGQKAALAGGGVLMLLGTYILIAQCIKIRMG